MASLSISKVEECLQQLEAEIAADYGVELPWWKELMEAYYPYPFQRGGSDLRAQYWRDSTIERLLNLQRILLRNIVNLKDGRVAGRNLHGVSREILRRQMETIKDGGIEFLNGKGIRIRC